MQKQHENDVDEHQNDIKSSKKNKHAKKSKKSKTVKTKVELETNWQNKMDKEWENDRASENAVTCDNGLTDSRMSGSGQEKEQQKKTREGQRKQMK